MAGPPIQLEGDLKVSFSFYEIKLAFSSGYTLTIPPSRQPVTNVKSQCYPDREVLALLRKRMDYI